MTLNPQFPNYANGPAGTEVIGWTVVGGQPLYRLPVAYVNTGFGAAFVCEGSTVEAPTYPEGVYTPDPNIESPGTISGTPELGETLTFAPGTVSGTQPITSTYNWIRYIPGGQSVVVGTGTTYVTTVADLGKTLIVQTVASNSVGTVATQTAPYTPITAPVPTITDVGTISKTNLTTSFNPGIQTEGVGSGNIVGITLVNPGQGYLFLLGAPEVQITGDGVGATATCDLVPQGVVVAVGEPTGGTTFNPNQSGTVTFAGEEGEGDIVLDWASDASNVITFTINDGGSGWTQANVDAAAALSYGTMTVTNQAEWDSSPFIGMFVGCAVNTITLIDGGTGYTNATVTIVPQAGDTFGSGATADAEIAPSSIILPGDTLSWTGATIVSDAPYIEVDTWVNADDPNEIWQLGGTTFVVPEAAAGKNVKVTVSATGSGGNAISSTNSLPVSAIVVVEKPSRISNYIKVDFGDTLIGYPAVFWSVPKTQTLSFGFYDADTDAPVGDPNSIRYTVTGADAGRSFVFKTTCTVQGTAPLTSVSDATVPVSSELVITKPTGIYFRTPEGNPIDKPNDGCTAYLIPGEVRAEPPATVVTEFGWFDGSTFTVLATDVTEFVVPTAQVGKQVAWRQTWNNGLSASSTSPSYPIDGGWQWLTKGSLTPLPILATQEFSVVYATADKALDAENVYLWRQRPGGPVEQLGRNLTYTPTVEDYKALFWNQTSASRFINGVTYSQNILTDTYECGGQTPSYIDNPVFTTVVFQSETPIGYQPGTYATTVPPVETQTWVWYGIKNGQETMLQNGGLSFTPNIGQVGGVIEVRETLRTGAAGLQTTTKITSPIIAPGAPITYDRQSQISVSSQDPSGVITATATLPAAHNQFGTPLTIDKYQWKAGGKNIATTGDPFNGRWVNSKSGELSYVNFQLTYSAEDFQSGSSLPGASNVMQVQGFPRITSQPNSGTIYSVFSDYNGNCWWGNFRGSFTAPVGGSIGTIYWRAYRTNNPSVNIASWTTTNNETKKYPYTCYSYKSGEIKIEVYYTTISDLGAPYDGQSNKYTFDAPPNPFG